MVDRVEKNRIEKIHLYILSDEERETGETDDKDGKENLGKAEPDESESQAS